MSHESEMTAEDLFTKSMFCMLDGKIEESVHLCRLAAEKGHKNAQNCLGHYYETTGDNASAFDWYMKAAEQGHEEARESANQVCRTEWERAIENIF